MAVSSAQVTVSTTPTALNTADPDDWTDLKIFVLAGGQTVFVGDSTVTTTTGYGLSTGTGLEIRIEPGDVLYGRVAATTQVVHVLRVS